MAIERETLLVLDVPTGGTSIRIMASGVGDASPAEAGIAITGRAVRPLSVVHLSAKQDTAGGMDLTWIRRSRDGWAWPDAIDAPLAEETEQYRITVQPDRGAEVVLDVLTPHATLTPTLLDGLRAAGARRARCFVTQIGSAGTSPPTQIDLDIVNRAAVR